MGEGHRVGMGAGGDPMALAARWQLRLSNAGSVSSRPDESGGAGGGGLRARRGHRDSVNQRAVNEDRT